MSNTAYLNSAFPGQEAALDYALDGQVPGGRVGTSLES